MFRWFGLRALVTKTQENRNIFQQIKPNAELVINNLNTTPKNIVGREEWSSLKNINIDDQLIVLDKMGDIHPTQLKPIFNCTTLVVKNCDKNFVYYWINSNVFPNVKYIFLLSHPCEPTFFSQWYNIQHHSANRITLNIFLAHYYAGYKNRWASEMNNVIVIDDNCIKILNDKLDELENKLDPDV